MADNENQEEPEYIEWTIDQEAWKLESILDGCYRLTKKAIPGVSESIASIDVTDGDLHDLFKVLAAREKLED